MKAKHMNALLVEIMMAVLFFALAATVILELFAAGHSLNRDSDILGRATGHARNLSEQIYAADDLKGLLVQQGFEQGATGWHASFGDYSLLVTAETLPAGSGEMRRAEVSAAQDDEVLVSLPCLRYFPGEVTP